MENNGSRRKASSSEARDFVMELVNMDKGPQNEYLQELIEGMAQADMNDLMRFKRQKPCLTEMDLINGFAGGGYERALR